MVEPRDLKAARSTASPVDPPEPQTHGAAREYDLRAIVEEVAAKTSRRSFLPLFIALLAACLALVTMADGAADRAASVAQLEAANQFSYFQAKNIRQTNSEIAAATLNAMGAAEDAQNWASRAERYRREKGDILAAARAEQASRAKFVRQGDQYSLSVALLQIAIVIASAAMVYRGYLLVTISVSLAALSAFFAANGYGLYYEIPAEPEAAFRWLASQVRETLP